MSDVTGKGAAQKDLSLLIGAGASPEALSAYLDGLDPETRVREVRQLSGASQQALYERCATAPALTLEFLVPPGTPPRQEIIFAGRNNLPLFRLFEKRFARTPSGSIVGYNHQSTSFATGPGYFTVAPAGNELLIDYTRVPTQDEVPPSWPKVLPNARGLSHLVYKDLHDYCRQVSKDVCIGHATRRGKSMPNYFVLVRRPVSPG